MSDPQVPSTAIAEASISINDSVAQEARLYINSNEWGQGEYVVEVLPGEGSKLLEMTHERIIRCRDCKMWGHACGLCRLMGYPTDSGDFCSLAESKEE